MSLMLEAIIGSVIIVPIVVVNVWHWRRRRKMTPYERAIEDA